MADQPLPANRELQLSDEHRQVLWEQFVQVYAEEQKSYDASLRAMAAGGLAITVSLGTALKQMPDTAKAAAGLFLASLLLNLFSHVTAQLDMRKRIKCLRQKRADGHEGNRWTSATTSLNFVSGGVLLAGGTLLTIFISHAT